MTQLIFLIIAVIIGSAFFSGLEAALFAIPMSRVHVLKKQERRGAKALSEIKEAISRPITVIVIGNNIVNIVGSIFVGAFATEVLGSVWLGLISALLTISIIIFGEIIPKTIGENYADTIALFFARPLLWATRVFSPIVWLLEKITKPFTKDKRLVSEEELQILSTLGHEEGSIEADERDIIQNVFTLNDLTARDLMTPRTMMFAFDADKRLVDLKEDIYTCPNSRIPVYEGKVDEIVGVVRRGDLLIALAEDQKDKRVRDLMRQALFVKEDVKADELLPLFQRERQHLAIVEDEFDGTSGVVTLEDVLEELVGEIVDETDVVVDTREEAEKHSRYTNGTTTSNE